jgi:hypothetical protein
MPDRKCLVPERTDLAEPVFVDDASRETIAAHPVGDFCAIRPSN